MQVQTYLYFDGCCEEALDFYREAVNAEVLYLLRFSDSPVPMDEACEGGGMPAGSEDKIMHCSFRIGETELMASDGLCAGKPDFQGFALSLVLEDKTAVEQAFTRLAAGGEIRAPLAETFFSPSFGMVVDRYGVLWNVLAEPRQ